MTELVLTIISALLTILAPFVVRFIQTKITDARIASAVLLVTDVVIATTQTFVDDLKKSGKWDEESKHQAFVKSKETAIALLAPEIRKTLEKTYGDVDLWLETVIQSTVKLTK